MTSVSSGTAHSAGQSLPTLSEQPLYTSMRSALGTQLAAADTAVSSYLAAHATRNDQAFDSFLVHQLPGPPASAAPELAQLHTLQDARTAADTATATFYDKQGDSGMWQGLLTAWQGTVNQTQAARGARMLQDAWHIADQATGEAKHQFSRERPFAQDPSLKPILVSPVNNHSSYPSQHVVNAFAAAAVLAALMPARAAEFEQDAEQVAFSRVYSNVHFPSDAVAGAMLGRLAAGYVAKFD